MKNAFIYFGLWIIASILIETAWRVVMPTSDCGIWRGIVGWTMTWFGAVFFGYGFFKLFFHLKL